MGNMIIKYDLRNIIIAILFLLWNSYYLSAQKSDSTITRINSFMGAVTIQSKGISTIPNLTLGKPAFTFDLKVGRKLSFEPQFRFALTGEPWAIVFWWRYYAVATKKFRLDLSTNYSFSYKAITVTTQGKQQELIRTTRYLVGAAAPDYIVNKYFSVGAYIFYNHGIERFITRNTLMLSFRPSISNIPITKNITARFYPEIYHLSMDDDGGVFFNARLSISKKNLPISVSALINKPIKSDIPSEYDLLWNVGLTYAFNKKYIEAP